MENYRGEFKVGDTVMWHDGFVGKIVKPCERFCDSWYLSSEYNSCCYKHLKLVKSNTITKSAYKEAKKVVKAYKKENKLKVGDPVKLKKGSASSYLKHGETYIVEKINKSTIEVKNFPNFKFTKALLKKA